MVFSLGDSPAAAHSSAVGRCLEGEMRKPFVRRDWRVLGRTRDRQPLDGLDVGVSLDPSLPLNMCTRGGADLILGDWQDAGYAWDGEPTDPALKFESHGAEARFMDASVRQIQPTSRDSWPRSGGPNWRELLLQPCPGRVLRPVVLRVGIEPDSLDKLAIMAPYQERRRPIRPRSGPPILVTCL